MASAPSARAYHRAHIDCLKAVGNYDYAAPPEEWNLLRDGIPRPFPFDLYLTRDSASRAFFPYKQELRWLDRRLKITEKEIEELKRIIANETKKPQGKLDL